MLVLSRKLSESIVIDGRITVTLVEVQGNKVRLGIEAPREISVHRTELLRAAVAHPVANEILSMSGTT